MKHIHWKRVFKRSRKQRLALGLTAAAFAGIGYMLLAPSSAAVLSISLQQHASGISGPTDVTGTGVPGDKRLFVTQKNGILRVVQANGTVNPAAVIDLDSDINSEGERGLLGVAFHPQYASNGYMFLTYTKNNGDLELSRFTRNPANPDTADIASRKVIITIPHSTHSNHNGGGVHFGPDGYLYLSVGDGGGGGDTDNNAQNNEVLLGKILRLDINSAEPYKLPADNPYVGKPGRDEIWASGLRNPWRFSFDRQTKEMFIGDVGQNAIEEISVQAPGVGGQNYGWRCYEGLKVYNGAGCQAASAYVMPAVQYDHSLGRCSVTGGVRYRGNAFPLMQGHYLYADFCSGHLYSLTKSGNGGWVSEQQGQFSASISAFGEDSDGEIYAVDHSRGLVYRIVAPNGSDAAAPSVTVTSPAANAQLSGTVPLGADANDNVGVVKVDFIVDGRTVNTDTSAPYTYNWNSASVVNGAHTVTALAADAAGNTKLSAAVAVTTNNASSLPAPWQTTDVGAVGAAGAAAYADNAFSVQGAGAGITGPADAFRFVYQSLAGDGQITARVDSLTNTGANARAGVMVRESLDAGAKHVTFAATAGSGVQLRYRSSPGGAVAGSVDTSNAVPVWLRLTRNGSQFTASVSADGETWVHAGSQTVAMNQQVLIGLPVSSYVSGTVTRATFGNVVVGFGVPAVDMQTPNHSQIVSGNFLVTATATDDNGIAKMEFYVDNVLAATDTSAPYSFVWDTTKVADGVHTVAAIAYDTAGNAGNHTHITTVRNSGTAKQGDINGDGRVNISDLSVLLSNYGKAGDAAKGDCNGDGRITVIDLSIVLSKWG